MNDDIEDAAAKKLRRVIETGSDITSAVLSAAAANLIFGPVGAAFGAGAGTFVGSCLRRVGQEVIERHLSPRESIRTGAIIQAASHAMLDRLNAGHMPRSDGFLNSENADRSAATEITESVILKCQREPEEKKIQYMGHLLAHLAFDSSIDLAAGHQLVNFAESLTYQQLVLVEFWSRLDDDESGSSKEWLELAPLNEIYPGTPPFSAHSITLEIHELHNRGLLIRRHASGGRGATVELGQTLKMGFSVATFAASPVAKKLRQSMSLVTLPSSEHQQVALILSGGTISHD